MATQTQKTIHVEYSPKLQKVCRVEEETLVTGANTPRELFELLNDQYDFDQDPQKVKVTVNNMLTSPDRPLRDGDHVSFIP